VKLPDGNILIARALRSHVNHEIATKFLEREKRIATCAITELNLVRVLMQLNTAPKDAFAMLKDILKRHGAIFIPSDLSATVISNDVAGHRATTDAYLARLAEKHGLTVATLDGQFASRWPKRVELVIPRSRER
jgi:predicted nucleic acid-binding protein